MHTLRWFLLIPGVILAWFAVFMLGLVTYAFVEKIFCSTEEMVSNFCINEQIQNWLMVLVHVFVALSAWAVILVAVAIAPGYKDKVLWVTLALGLAVAAYLAYPIDAWSLFAVAAVSGIASAMLIARHVLRTTTSD